MSLRLLRFVLAALAGALGLVATSASGTAVASRMTPSSRSCSNPERLASWSNSRLAMMTIAVPAEETDVAEAEPEVAGGAGGVLLFGTAAPTNLGAQLTSLRRVVPGNLGLLVMTDEEGGGVQRMANLVGSLPWPRTMGQQRWTATEIESAVETVAKKMAAAGVNMDLAPVVDVDPKAVEPGDSDPDGYRAFSGNVGVVERDGTAFMKGLIEGGDIPVLKHFPGLGQASGNTDVEPAHTLPWAEEKKIGLPPFIHAMRNGAPAVMVSNATVPGLATWPASLSPAVMHELEVTLGFHGLVMTDSLSADAISAAGFTVPEAAARAIAAGADMVLFGLPGSSSALASETDQIAASIVAAVSSGLIPRSRLVAAAGAVLAVRHIDLCK